MTQPDVVRLKRKILGVLVRSARMQVGLNIDETARQLGISSSTLADYEFGRQEASLPELEAMARIFAVPIDYFWSNGLLKTPDKDYQAARAIAIRRKIIGVLLRQTREAAGYTQNTLAEAASCSVDRIASYELGKKDIPFMELTTLASCLNVSVSHFLENGQQEDAPQEDAVPVIVEQQPTEPNDVEQKVTLSGDFAWLEELPDDVKDFLADPTSLLYLKLSMRLHNLSAETLRMLAEGILDITY